MVTKEYNVDISQELPIGIDVEVAAADVDTAKFKVHPSKNSVYKFTVKATDTPTAVKFYIYDTNGDCKYAKTFYTDVDGTVAYVPDNWMSEAGFAFFVVVNYDTTKISSAKLVANVFNATMRSDKDAPVTIEEMDANISMVEAMAIALGEKDAAIEYMISRNNLSTSKESLGAKLSNQWVCGLNDSFLSRSFATATVSGFLKKSSNSTYLGFEFKVLIHNDNGTISILNTHGDNLIDGVIVTPSIYFNNAIAISTSDVVDIVYTVTLYDGGFDRIYGQYVNLVPDANAV